MSALKIYLAYKAEGNVYINDLYFKALTDRASPELLTISWDLAQDGALSSLQ
jgi:hypothetical protein